MLFGRDHLSTLCGLSGDAGARALIDAVDVGENRDVERAGILLAGQQRERVAHRHFKAAQLAGGLALFVVGAEVLRVEHALVEPAVGLERVVIGGSIDGTGALVKSGTGILTLNGTSTFAGTTTLDAGTLNLTSAGALGTSAVTVNAGTLVANANLGNAINLLAGSLQGSGNVGATNIAAGAILSPGNSPGTLTHASLTLTGGSIIEWQITDALAAGISKTDSALVAGSAYDTLAITGALDISGASAANPITVRVVSLANPTDLTPGDANNFDTMMVNRFKFAEVGSLVTNATPFADLFTYDLSGFTDSDGAVSEVDLWAMSFESNVLWLTAVPQLLSYGILAPGNAPGFLTLADLNLTGRATFEISKLPQIGGYYNDTVEFTIAKRAHCVHRRRDELRCANVWTIDNRDECDRNIGADSLGENRV